MEIELILFRSPMHDRASVLSSRHSLLAGLRTIGVLTVTESTDYKPSELDSERITICFISTGGTEESFLKLASVIPDPIVLLCDGYHNSLAASLEICTWLSQQKREYELINVPTDYKDLDFLSLKLSCIQIKALMGGIMPITPSRVPTASPGQSLQSIYSSDKVADYLRRSTIGIIGGESSWLISSEVDTDYIKERFGAGFVYIDMGEIISNYNSLPEEMPLNSLPEGVTDCSREKEIRDALRMYKVLSDVCEKYSLTALTIKCFDLLETCCTTACMALAFLNDRGIVSGCEGDIPALWTMMVGYALTGKSSFMANPSSSSEDEYTIDFAHCTVPFSMTRSYALPSHFESGIGVGIEGDINLGPCSIVKISGRKLDTIYSINGKIVTNTRIPQRCRSQIRIQVNDKTDYDSFFSSRFGNHVIVTPFIFNQD